MPSLKAFDSRRPQKDEMLLIERAEPVFLKSFSTTRQHLQFITIA